MNSTSNTPAAPNRDDDISRVGLVSLNRAAEFLGMRDPRTVRKLVRENRLKARKIGSRVLITTESLVAFVEG